MAIVENQKKKRYRIFSAACELSQFLCIRPWFDNKKNEFKWPLGYQLYSLFFGFGVISGLGVVLYRSERKTVNEVDGVLTGLNTTMLVLLVAILVLGSNLNRYSWKFLLTEVGNLTSALVEETEATHILDEFYLQFYLGHVVFIGVVVFVTYFVQYDHILSIYCLLTEFVVEYYCFIATTIICNFIILAKWKYRNIVKMLDDIDVKADDLDKTLTQIVSVGHSCKMMSELVDCCNRIQGWQVLWLLGRAVLQLLRSVNWLIAIGDDFKWPSFMAVILNAFIGLGESAYIILCCESATAAGNKVEKTCHKLQENFELTSKAREELFRLAEITKSFAPKFTAANFFVINKGTILGIINIATTYLIVIIQFNDSVKHKSAVAKTHE